MTGVRTDPMRFLSLPRDCPAACVIFLGAYWYLLIATKLWVPRTAAALGGAGPRRSTARAIA
jgi:hypothetical protein